jgi:hypothetical protein
MGHSQLETTMGYLHAEAMSVASPLDAQPSNIVAMPAHGPREIALATGSGMR